MMPASGIILKPNVSFNLDEFFPTASAALLFLFFSPPDWEKSSAVTYMPHDRLPVTVPVGE